MMVPLLEIQAARLGPTNEATKATLLLLWFDRQLSSGVESEWGMKG